MRMQYRTWLLALAATGLLVGTANAQNIPPAPLPDVIAQQPVSPPSAPAPPPAQAQNPIPAPPPAVTLPAHVSPAYNPELLVLEQRLSKLEGDLKKKADKPDSKKAFTAKLDGRVFLDSYNVMDQGGADVGAPANYSSMRNWNGLRDLRVGVKGEGYGIFDYKIDLSFVQGTGSGNNRSGVNLKDVFLGVKNVPLLEYVKIGNYRVEDGIAALTGAPNMTFMEFHGPSRDFAYSRRIGISSRHLWLQDRMRFFAGVFALDDIASVNRYEQQDNQGIITNLRLTYLPYISCGKDGKPDGRKFMHFGVNYSFVDVTKNGENPDPFTSRYAELQIGNVFNVNVFAAQHQRLGLEFAAQSGPWMVGSEAFAKIYDDAAVLNITNNRKQRTVYGLYVEGRVFLTGDYRKYNTASGAWGEAVLKHNLDLRKVNDTNYACWLGAWEFAAKWSYTDMSELWEVKDAVRATTGNVHELTLGLNWYWTSQARWMLHYSHVMPNRIRADQPRDNSTTDILALSFRYHF